MGWCQNGAQFYACKKGILKCLNIKEKLSILKVQSHVGCEKHLTLVIEKDYEFNHLLRKKDDSTSSYTPNSFELFTCVDLDKILFLYYTDKYI